MKKALLVALLAILLTACATPTPSPTVTVPPKPSASPAPSATATETLTPSPTGTPTATPLPPITLVTSREQMYQHPETLPDGSTPEKRKEIAATILQMYKDGEIPNFGPDVQPYIPTRDRINDSANKFQSFFIPEDSSDWSDVSKRAVMGVTLVYGGEGVYYGVQAVKQEGTDAPGLIWYEVGGAEYSQYEIDMLFNNVADALIKPAWIKGSGCYESLGKALCKKYLEPDLVAAQINVITDFVKTHQIPEAMTYGQVIFLMIRGSIGV